ncbi:MAG: hypothetical protein HOF20_00950 [Pelagibacteraceae bacterium]|nr:hypothetical protein [Pelagibacteraceae bacterium]
MKIRPEILLNNNSDFFYNKILVTGSDESFINYMREHIIKFFKNKNYFIDLSGNYNRNLAGDLFSNKKVLFVLKEYSSKKEGSENTSLDNQSVLIASPNGKKINTVKNNFSNSKNSLVIDCYPLNRKGKELTLRQYIDKNNIDLSNDIFWYIIENFDNQYVLFIQQLKTLNLLGGRIDSVDIIEKAVFIDNKIDLSKIFFNVLRSNKYLINIFNKNIYSQADFYIFLNSLKSYLEIISSSNSKEGVLLKFPRYLFAERDVFVQIYTQLNKKKIFEIYKNISRVESLVRKNSSLYSVIGLRFLLNTKKIITS